MKTNAKVKLPGKYSVNSSVVINASQATIWALLKDFGNVQDWAPQVSKSYYLDNQTSGVGTGRHCDIKGFGSIQERVTEWEEGVGFTYSVTPLGPLSISYSRWHLTRLGENQTKLEVSFHYNVRFGLLGKILHALVMRKKLEKSLPETLASTKNHVEGFTDVSTASEPLVAVGQN